MSERPDLSTTYLGLSLAGPVIASAGPLTRTPEDMLALQDAGAAAVVLPSLFQEEAEAEEMQAFDMAEIGDGFAEFDSAPLPPADLDDVGPNRHVNLVKAAKQALTIPVIGSVNGSTEGGWQRYATLLQDAGADAVELNLHSVNADPQALPADIEDRYLRVIAGVKSALSVPLAVKMSSHFTSVSNFASRARDAGADALVLFSNVYGTDIDLDELTMVPRVTLSSSDRIRLPMRWIGIVSAQQKGLDLAASSGVHTWEDALKLLLVGANVVCTTSAVLQGGPEAVTGMLDGLRSWLAERGYDSVEQLRGSMNFASVGNPGAYERDAYMKVITSTPVA